MEKKLKIKCIMGSICIIIGVMIFLWTLYAKNMSELQRGYLSGFGTSLAVACAVLLIKNLLSLKDPKLLKKREIEITDERNREIYRRSLAMTCKICLIVECLASIILVCLNHSLGIYLGWIIGIELIIFCVTNVFIARKM